MATDADLLREAAAKMRERAQGFITEDSTPPRVDIDRDGTCDDCGQHLHLVASYPDFGSEPWLCAPCAAYADHVSGWTQPVALAVADWLDAEARAVEFDGGTPDLLTPQALNLARTYLQQEDRDG